MNRLPFRFQITLWSAVVAIVSTLFCGAGAAWFVYQQELAELDESLRADANHFFSELRREGGENFNWATLDEELREWVPEHRFRRIIEIAKGADVKWHTKALAFGKIQGLPVGIRDARIDGSRAHLLIAEQDGVFIGLAGTLDEAFTTRRDLAFGLLVTLPFTLALAWLGGRSVAALAVAPVVRMTSAAESVTAENIDLRVPVPVVADEIQRHAMVLNATLDRLERSYHQALRFSADASHELKTPLTVMRACLEDLLHSKTLGLEERGAIGSLLEQTHRLTGITSSLLLLSRADAGYLVLDLTEQNLSAFVDACVEDARVIGDQHGISVESSLPERAPARVDAIRFSQIVSNLIENALKYNLPGGKVCVAISSQAARWEVKVGNTGPTIKPEHQAKIFDRFYRGYDEGDHAGQGLGLSLARELARAHGGNVELVQSEANWTEFIATFPHTGSQTDLSPTPKTQTRQSMKSLAIVLAAASLVLTSRAADDPTKALAKIPAPAAESLKKYAADHSMKIEQVSTEKHGKVTVYEAVLTSAGQPNHEVAVTSDGKVKGEEETVPMDKVPEGARKAIEAGAKGQKVQRVQRIQEDGMVTFEAAYVNAKGKVTEVEYLEDGKPKPEAK